MTPVDGCLVGLDALIPADEQLALVRQVLEKQHRLELTVHGSCMRPWVRSGDTIEVRPLDRPPRIGMTVLLQRDERLLAHRIIRLVRDGSLISRGDLSPTPDPPTRESAILGEVVRVTTKAGRVIRLDRHWVQRLGLRGAPFLRVARTALRRLRAFAG